MKRVQNSKSVASAGATGKTKLKPFSHLMEQRKYFLQWLDNPWQVLYEPKNPLNCRKTA